jgi:folate-dependent tRNA-U54 methylase TrmFO/GidA
VVPDTALLGSENFEQIDPMWKIGFISQEIHPAKQSKTAHTTENASLICSNTLKP